MRKTIIALVLALTFTVNTLADGNTPIMGYAGCPGGLWYPISQVCCMPGEQCPAGRAAPVLSADTKDTILVDWISLVKNICF